jgi:hypothetical protein
MHRGLGHPSVPFLSAALAALALYRILETGLGWNAQEVFAIGLGGATFLTAALVLAALVRKPRQE